ncbi:MAG: type II toxin-antitoxin system HicB family antitoxin [Candidatus Diapherotrites archaeon]|nr:type II toxin-antitoxin system HicB family antitoxin [Candidatus Diapherotrites archaeon]
MAKIKNYSVVVSRGEIAFVAYCPELGVTSQGKSEKSALKNLKEAIELYLEDSGGIVLQLEASLKDLEAGRIKRVR